MAAKAKKDKEEIKSKKSSVSSYGKKSDKASSSAPKKSSAVKKAPKTVKITKASAVTDVEKPKTHKKTTAKKTTDKRKEIETPVEKPEQKSIQTQTPKPIIETPKEIEIEIKQESFIQQQSVPIPVKEEKSAPKSTLLASEEPIVKEKIEINELINVRTLAEKMNKKAGEVLMKLLAMGSMATINQRLDIDVAILLSNEFGFEAVLSSLYSEEEKEVEAAEDPSKLKPRFPIVTIMGHVDHGKTSLLDTLRKSHIAEKEFGGITQHIGAYKVKTNTGGYITFLDTPGHEAFTAMRSRGAQATDIVILVVSAADGVMPQTIEAINHAKDADVPIIVAINKIDLPAADPQKIKQELSSYGLLAEDWGGKTIMVEISAKKQINIELLLENVLLQAEMMSLKANPDRPADGIVIEAKLDSRKGTTVTLLVKRGTLKIGDTIVVGTTYGKIKAMSDEYGKRLQAAPPSSPVEVLGINEPPQSGDKFVVIKDEHQAREIAQSRKEKDKASSQRPKHKLSLEDISAGKTKNLKIILKADVQGSLGALCDALERLSTSEIDLKIIHRGAGSITESDVSLAVASDALIIGFNLRPDASVEKMADSEGVSIHVYRIIYDLIADVRAAMEGLLDPDMKEKVVGKASVKQVFKLSSAGSILGCLVIEGTVQRRGRARLLRDNVIIFEGNISSLKRFKEDVKEVEKGYECGIGLENFNDVKVGDIIETFITEKIARKLG